MLIVRCLGHPVLRSVCFLPSDLRSPFGAPQEHEQRADSWYRTVYEAVGFAEDALLINSINSVMGILGQVACVLFLDKVGRRIPLVGGNIMSGCMFIGAT